MSTPQSLPAQANLDQLKKQAKDRVKKAKTLGQSLLLKEAQREVAQSYGFKDWAELKVQVEGLELAGQLKTAIDAEDLERVRGLLTTHPELHRAKMGYGGDGPLTWVAECRRATPPSAKRLAIAKLMLELGSDIHQGHDGPLMRACMSDGRLPMAELLLQHGADVNAQWHEFYPIICTPCECLAPQVIRWLLEHGADPNVASSQYGYPLDMAIGTYERDAAQHACVEALVQAGAKGKAQGYASLPIHRGRLDLLKKDLERDPGLLNRCFPEFDYGGTAHRGLNLKGTTLLHVAAEFCEADAVRVLLERGADPNVRALFNAAGVGGQTPIFHAVTQYRDQGLEVSRLLIEAGADLNMRCTIRGKHDDEQALLTVTPLGYAARFPFGNQSTTKTVELLIQRGAAAGDLYAAARAGCCVELKELLKAGVTPESPEGWGPDGDSAVAVALAHGRTEAAELLVKAGAQIGIVEACRLGNTKRVEELLLQDPALVKARFGERQWTPLFFAVVDNRIEVLEVLHRFHALLAAQDQYEQCTALHRAVEYGCTEAVRWLLAHGAPADARTRAGKTPLEWVGRNAKTEIVELFKS